MSDLIDREALLRQIDIDSEGEPGYYGDTWKFIDTIKSLPSALSTNLAEVGTDCISRQQAIDALDEQIALCDKALKSFGISMKDEYAVKVERASLVAFREKLEYLQPAQPEPCEDAVSRAEVLRMINCINDHHAITPYKSVGAVTEHLTRIASNLPPVTPKQRTGKWIYHIDDLFPAESTQECDQCHSEQPLTCDDEFCPHCGAKMEGADDE